MQKRLKLNIQLFGASASASASLTSSGGNKATLSVSFTENSTNITANTSNISCSASITMNTGSFSGISSPMLYLYWHDNHNNTDSLIASKNVTSYMDMLLLFGLIRQVVNMFQERVKLLQQIQD